MYPCLCTRSLVPTTLQNARPVRPRRLSSQEADQIFDRPPGLIEDAPQGLGLDDASLMDRYHNAHLRVSKLFEVMVAPLHVVHRKTAPLEGGKKSVYSHPRQPTQTATSTSSTRTSPAGIAKPSIRMPSSMQWIASLALSNASSLLSPSVMQPGNDGTVTVYPPPSSFHSKITLKRLLIARSPRRHYTLDDAPSGAGVRVQLGRCGPSTTTWRRAAPKLWVTPTLSRSELLALSLERQRLRRRADFRLSVRMAAQALCTRRTGRGTEHAPVGHIEPLAHPGCAMRPFHLKEYATSACLIKAHVMRLTPEKPAVQAAEAHRDGRRVRRLLAAPGQAGALLALTPCEPGPPSWSEPTWGSAGATGKAD